jgi:hypothetical protein
MLEAWGLSREAKREELRNLALSVWDILTKTDLEFDASLTLVERMETKLWGTLQWP